MIDLPKPNREDFEIMANEQATSIRVRIKNLNETNEKLIEENKMLRKLLEEIRRDSEKYSHKIKVELFD